MSDIIDSSEELGNLTRGTVIASPNYMDAFSVVGQPPIRGVVYGLRLMNCATGYHASLAEMPGFLPATVIYSADWGKMSGIYYRVIAETGDVITLQEFDERDYDPRIWLTDFRGKPLAFRTPEDAKGNYLAQIREVSEAIRMIGEAFGKLTIPDDSRFLAHKLVSHFKMVAPDEPATVS